jgi:Holliday junction resolvasome RuvABC endonuclease subunit
MKKSKEEIVLCLDVSKKCTGYCLASKKDLIKYGKYVADGDEDNAAKLYNFTTWLDKMIISLPYKPTTVVIESIFYRRNVKTHAILNQYMGACLAQVYKTLHIEPILIAPRTVKYSVRPKKGKSHDENKLNMVNKINQLYGLDLRFHKNNKDISDDDIADAIALYLTYFKKLDNDE